MKKKTHTMSVANIAEDHQEHICVEKVVAKKVTGGEPCRSELAVRLFFFN